MATNTQVVLDYFLAHPDELITLDTMVKDLKHERAVITSAIGNLRRNDFINLERVAKGVYRYSPNGTEAGDEKPRKHAVGTRISLDVLQVKEDGAMLLRDTDGSVWKCVHLDW